MKSQIETKNDIVDYAIKKCLQDMYSHAIPKTTYEKAIEEFKNSSEEDQKEYPMYTRYYISDDLYKDLLETYMSIYGLGNNFSDSIDLLLEYLQKGMYNTHYNEMPLNKIIPEEYAEKCINHIKDIQETVRPSAYHSTFRWNVMNYSPTCNKLLVKNYWKHKGVDIKI